MQGSKIRTEQRGVGPNEGREVVEGNYARLEIKGETTMRKQRNTVIGWGRN